MGTDENRRTNIFAIPNRESEKRKPLCLASMANIRMKFVLDFPLDPLHQFRYQQRK